MADDSKPTSVVGKVMATVFGAILAPLLVAIGIKWADPNVWRPTTPGAPTPPKEVALAEPATHKKKHVEPPPPPPTTRPGRPHTGKANPTSAGGDDVVNLLAGKPGDHFYSYLHSEGKKMARNDSVDTTLFKYVASPPSVTIPGGAPGALMTKKEYDDYTLTVEFRGADKHSPREKARPGAILLHATGPDGAFEKTSPQCVAVLLNEGELGTIQLRGLPGKVKAIARMKETPDRRRAYVGGEMLSLPLVSGEPAGWNGCLYRLATPEGDPTRGGDWNKVLITCEGDTLTVVVNEKKVNEITGLNIKKGRIGFATSNADCTFRKIELENFRH